MFTQLARMAILEYEKRKGKLIYVPRYNMETDSFETNFTLPNAADALGTKEHGHAKDNH
jgi:hypothetical protein